MLATLSQVTKTFRSGDSTVRVLDACDLQVGAAETVAIVGPSGSGKSTLLNLLGALDHPDSGEITVDGVQLSTLRPAELAVYRATKVGFIFQLHHLLPQCTVLENVLIPVLSQPGGATAALRERAAALLASVGLSHRLDHRPGQLSGGERQRAAVARALIASPKLLLADEPTGALDRSNAERLADLLAEVNERERAAIVMVTHAPDLARRMSRVLELREGKLVAA